MSRTWNSAASLIAIVLCAALWAGCGVKSAPVPPMAATPERITDLTAKSVKAGVRLSWGRPTHYALGGKMDNLGRFVVLRTPEKTTSYRQLGTVAVTDQQRFQKQKHFSFLDKSATLGHTYTYAVIAETLDHYRSQPSNRVVITRAVPKPPPSPEHFVLPTPTPLP